MREVVNEVERRGGGGQRSSPTVGSRVPRDRTTTPPPPVGSRVPRDRPRQMIDTGIPWIGQVPEGWEVSPIRYVFDEVTRINSDGKIQNALRFSMGSIVAKENFDATGEEYVAETIKKYTVVEKDDIVLNGLNLNYDFVSQRVARVPAQGVITSAYISFRVHDSLTIDPKYALYQLKGYDAFKVFHGMGEGVRKILNFSILRLQPILLPPLPTQRAIAAYLDGECGKIDALRTKIEAQIADLATYKKSVITEAVTGKAWVERKVEKRGGGGQWCVSPRSAKEMKPSGVEWIGDVPTGWEVWRFVHWFDFAKGLNITKADLVEEGVPVVSYGQIHSKSNVVTRITDELIRFVPRHIADNGNGSQLRKGDILFADTSEDYEGAGNCVHVDSDRETYAGYHTLIARPHRPEHSRYLSYLFQSVDWKSQIARNVNGIKVFSVTQKVFRDVTLIIPLLPEQREIAAYLDEKCAAIDAAVAKCREQLTDLASYKKSLIYECVTGKKEVA